VTSDEKKASRWVHVDEVGQVTEIRFRTASGNARQVTHSQGIRLLFEDCPPKGYRMRPVSFAIIHTAAPRTRAEDPR
jgi:hypothetical protein